MLCGPAVLSQNTGLLSFSELATGSICSLVPLLITVAGSPQAGRRAIPPELLARWLSLLRVVARSGLCCPHRSFSAWHLDCPALVTGLSGAGRTRTGQFLSALPAI